MLRFIKLCSMLATNPYNCDCDMTWFMKRLHRKDFSQILLDYKDMECQKPAHLKGRKIYLLKEKDVCNPSMLLMFIMKYGVCSVFTLFSWHGGVMSNTARGGILQDCGMILKKPSTSCVRTACLKF